MQLLLSVKTGLLAQVRGPGTETVNVDVALWVATKTKVGAEVVALRVIVEVLVTGVATSEQAELTTVAGNFDRTTGVERSRLLTAAVGRRWSG